MACLAALSSGINLGASMNDETPDADVPIVPHLPVLSNTATVDEQEDYLKKNSNGYNNPLGMPGYIPGQRNIIDHQEILEKIKEKREKAKGPNENANENADKKKDEFKFND